MQTRIVSSGVTEFKQLASELKAHAYAVGLRNDSETKDLITIIDRFTNVDLALLESAAMKGNITSVEEILDANLHFNVLHRLYQRILDINHTNDQLREAPALLARIDKVWKQMLYQTVLNGYKVSRYHDNDDNWLSLCRSTKNNVLAAKLIAEFVSDYHAPQQNLFSQALTHFFGNGQANIPVNLMHPDLSAPLAYNSYKALDENYLTSVLYNPNCQFFNNMQDGWVAMMTAHEEMQKTASEFGVLLRLCMEKGDYTAALNSLYQLRHNNNLFLEIYRVIVFDYFFAKYANTGKDLSEFKQVLVVNNVCLSIEHLMQLWESHIQTLILENIALMLATDLNQEVKNNWDKFVADIKAKQPEGNHDKWHGRHNVRQMLAAIHDPQLLSPIIEHYILTTANLRKHKMGLFDQPVKVPEQNKAPVHNRRHSL